MGLWHAARQVVLAILLDHPCKAALPCSSLPPAVLLREGGSCEFLQSLGAEQSEAELPFPCRCGTPGKYPSVRCG